MPSRGRGGRHAVGRKSAEGGRRYREKASPAAVETYLWGVNFPATKEDLIDCARENRAPGDVLHVLDKLDDKEYRSVVDITQEVGKFD